MKEKQGSLCKQPFQDGFKYKGNNGPIHMPMTDNALIILHEW